MFLLLAIALAIGIGIGALTGGSPNGLRNLKIRWFPLVFFGLIPALIPLFVEMPKGPRQAMQFLGLALVLAFLAANIAGTRGAVRAGFVVLLAGWALNAVVIVANNGMPLSLWALRAAGITEAATPGEGGFYKIVIADKHTLLRPLGDVIPIRAIGQVLSLGDIVLIVGIAWVIAAGMRLRARDPEQAPIDG